MKLYTSKNCEPCKRVKKWLDDRGISYTELDIHERANAKAYRSLNSPGVPLLVSNKKDHTGKLIAIVGYRPDLLEVLCDG